MSSVDLSPRQRAREPQLLRFRLRHLFFVVTLICLLSGVLVLTDGPWGAVITLFAALVAAHVVGNLVGTKLRDTSGEVSLWRDLHPYAAADRPVRTDPAVPLGEIELPRDTPLADHGWAMRWGRWPVVVGLILGLMAGAIAIVATMGERATAANFTVAIVSASVLGGWVAFLASSFGSITRHALQHANAERLSRKPPANHDGKVGRQR